MTNTKTCVNKMADYYLELPKGEGDTKAKPILDMFNENFWCDCSKCKTPNKYPWCSADGDGCPFGTAFLVC